MSMGQDGWELVAVIEGREDSFVTYYFKRPKPNETA